MRLIHYGNSPVPWTVGFTGEQPYGVAYCPHAKQLALFQPQTRQGKPTFASPNFCRQRAAIINGLCDLCAKPLKSGTKVSLSKVIQGHTSSGIGYLQVEPMLHRECATICMKYCPHLLAMIEQGRLNVRQVTRWRPQLAMLPPITVAEHVPGYRGPRDAVAGYAKVQLLEWIDRDASWLA